MSDTALPIPDAAPAPEAPTPPPVAPPVDAGPVAAPFDGTDTTAPAQVLEATKQRGPDGRFAASPPPAAPATQPVPAPAHESPVAERPVRDKRDYAREQWEALTRNNGSSPGTDAPAPPGPQITLPPSAAPGADSPPPPAFNPTTPAAAAPPDQPDPYGGTLTKRTADLLKSVNMLPPPAEWAAMDADRRAEHVETVKEMRRTFHRQNEQQRRAQQLPPPAADNESDSGLLAPRAGDAGSPGQPGVSDLRQLPEPIRQQLAALAEEVSEQSPIYQAQLQTALHYESQLRQERVTRQQATVESRFRLAEDAVFAKLNDAIPQVADPLVREDLRGKCRAYASSWAQALANQGYTPQEIATHVTADAVVPLVARAQFSQEIQQRERERLDVARQRSLAQSAERGVARPAPPPPATPRDAARSQFERLRALESQGVSGRAALDRVMAGTA